MIITHWSISFIELKASLGSSLYQPRLFFDAGLYRGLRVHRELIAPRIPTSPPVSGEQLYSWREPGSLYQAMK
jgi:hypothetical protein